MLALTFALTAMLNAESQTSFIEQVREAIKTDPTRAESLIRTKFKPDDLSLGTPPLKEGTTALFAIEPKSSEVNVSIVGDNLEQAPLPKVGKLHIGIFNFRSGLGTTLQYNIDGKPTSRTYNLELYNPNPIVETPPGGLKGELREMGEWKSKIYPNTTRKWYVYLPPNFDKSQEHPVLIGTDAQWDRNWQTNAIENATREGLIPPTVGIFIEPGQNTPGTYSNRSYEYDRLTPDYANFLLEEIFPEVQKIVKLSSNPRHRAHVGISSGGICGFTLAWQRPDQFGTVISGVGSFDNIAYGESKIEGGHNYPFLIRLSEPKPIRAFIQGGTHDLDNQFGNWFLGNAQMASALKFKGYDHQWHAGEGFHSSEHLRSNFDQALVWWNGKK